MSTQSMKRIQPSGMRLDVQKHLSGSEGSATHLKSSSLAELHTDTHPMKLSSGLAPAAPVMSEGCLSPAAHGAPVTGKQKLAAEHSASSSPLQGNPPGVAQHSGKKAAPQPAAPLAPGPVPPKAWLAPPSLPASSPEAPDRVPSASSSQEATTMVRPAATKTRPHRLPLESNEKDIMSCAP